MGVSVCASSMLPISHSQIDNPYLLSSSHPILSYPNSRRMQSTVRQHTPARYVPCFSRAKAGGHALHPTLAACTRRWFTQPAARQHLIKTTSH